MDELIQDMADLLAGYFFKVYIIKGDTDKRWSVACESRKGHDEVVETITGFGETISGAIIDAYCHWKKIV